MFPLELCIDEGIGPYGRDKHSGASKQHCLCYDTHRCHWDVPAPRLLLGIPAPGAGKEEVQSKQSMAQGLSSPRGDPTAVESSQHPWRFGCHFPAQAFHLSKSLPASPRLFPSLCEHNPSLGRAPHRPRGKAQAYTSRQNPSFFGSQGRAQQESWQEAGVRCCALRCRASPRGETHPTGAESRWRHVHVCPLPPWLWLSKARTSPC